MLTFNCRYGCTEKYQNRRKFRSASSCNLPSIEKVRGLRLVNLYLSVLELVIMRQILLQQQRT